MLPGTLIVVDAIVRGGPPGALHLRGRVVSRKAIGRPTHGIWRLPAYVGRIGSGSIKCPCEPRFQGQDGATDIMDGDAGIGHYVGHAAMLHAIDRARSHGIGAVGVHNSNHFGAGSYFVQLAAKHDMVGVAMFQSITSVSFDRLDSDGCMSTNDTVTLLASGASGITPTLEDFTEALTRACTDLAMQLLADAEGADHEIAITVLNAASEDEAVEVGRSIARSNLFKAAVFGKDPNWGRVLASIGTTSAAFDPADLDVAMNGVWVCRASEPAESPELVDLSAREVSVTIDLKAGDARATVWTNDLTHAYVHENSAYSS